MKSSKLFILNLTLVFLACSPGQPGMKPGEGRIGKSQAEQSGTMSPPGEKQQKSAVGNQIASKGDEIHPPPPATSISSALDFPVTESLRIPGCVQGKDYSRVQFHEDGSWSILKRSGKGYSLERFKTDGSLLFSRSFPHSAWFHADSFSSEGHFAFARFEHTRDVTKAAHYSFAVTLVGPDGNAVGKPQQVGEVCMGLSPCDKPMIQYLFNLPEKILYVLWIPSQKAYGEWFISVIDLPSGSLKQKAIRLSGSKLLDQSPIGDRLRELIGGTPLEIKQGVFKEAKTSLFEKGVAQVSIDLGDPNPFMRSYTTFLPCRLQNVNLRFSTGDGDVVPLFDKDVFTLVRPHCVGKEQDILLKDFQIEHRPGGGFFVLFGVGVSSGDWRWYKSLDTFVREYDAEGKPLGLPRKVQFRRIRKLSDSSWQAESDCHREIHQKSPKSAN